MTIATNLRHLAVSAVLAGAALVGITAVGDLATADAADSIWVIGSPNAPQNCRATGGVWVWDGFEMGHCERRVSGGVLSPGLRA